MTCTATTATIRGRTTVKNRPTYQSVLPDLADTWLAAYKAALDEGLKWRTSGPWTDDPHCAAAAALTAAACRGWWPDVYGGTQRTKPYNRWSATRKAALAVFERGIVLGISAAGSAWLFTSAKMLARTRLGISRFDASMKIEVWEQLSPHEKNVRFLEVERNARWEEMILMAQCAPNDETWISPGRLRWRWERGDIPLSQEDLSRREQNLAKLMSDLVGAASF